MGSKEPKEVNVKIKDMPINQVNTFKFLGNQITEDGGYSDDKKNHTYNSYI